MVNEFKKFAFKGNMVDLAVGVIIGAAFGKLITSFVNDIIMPPIGMLLGKVNFSDLYINLSSTKYASLQEAQAAGAPTINYGLFFNNIIDFLIVALAIFIVVKQFERFKKKEEVQVTTKTCQFCCSEIPVQAVRCPNCTSELK